MKKIAIAVALMLIVTMLTTGVAYAGSAFSNARAEFEPVPSRGVDTASGYAIINYAKGQQNWQVQGSLQNLRPNTDYNVEVGQQGIYGGVTVAWFTTDASGNKDFHSVATGLPEAYNVVRIVEGEGPSVSGWIKMVAREDGTLGLLRFRGGQRGG